MWTKPDNYDRIDSKGIEVKRRDTMPFVRNSMAEILNVILKKGNIKAAVSYFKKRMSDLLQNKIDFVEYIMGTTLNKRLEEYKSKTIASELTKKLILRCKETAPRTGDKVSYVIIAGNKKDKAYQKVEDPDYALENNIELDIDYYIEKKIKKPILKIFAPILKDTNRYLNNVNISLFQGEHMRIISKKSITMGNMVKYTVKIHKCSNCKAKIDVNYFLLILGNLPLPLCNEFYPNQKILVDSYLKTLNENTRIQNLYQAYIMNCYSCQGAWQLDIVCNNKDCSKFYEKRVVKMKVEESNKKMLLFNNIDLF
jgi:DNA polymerase delta subunit 1